MKAMRSIMPSAAAERREKSAPCRFSGAEMPLYNRLKEHRNKLGVNQEEMGRLVGVSRQTISLIERGDYSPSVTLALKLAAACGVTVEDIFRYEEDGMN